MSVFVARFLRLFQPLNQIPRKALVLLGGGLLSGILLIVWGFTHPTQPPAQAGESTLEKTAVKESETQSPSETNANEIELSPEAIANAGIKLAVAGPAMLQQSSEFPGRIAVDQHRQQAVSARFSGVLTHMSKHAGERVRQGELIAQIESRELAELRLVALNRRKALEQVRRLRDQEAGLQDSVRRLMGLLKNGGNFESLHQQALNLPIGEDKARLLSAYSRLKISSRQLNRERQLFNEKISSEQDYLQAVQTHETDLSAYSSALEEIARQRDNQTRAKGLDYDLAASELETSMQQLRAFGDTRPLSEQNLTRFDILAPRSGVLIDKRASDGEQVSAESVLYVIADLSEVWAEMQIYSSDLTGVKPGMAVNIRSEDGRLRTEGHLAHLMPVVDETSRTAEAHAEIKNPKGHWFPGMYVTLELIRSRSRVAVAVESAALQQIKGKPVVFVRTPAGFSARSVKIGKRGKQTEILSGLKAGEHYALANSFVLKSTLLGKE